MLNSGYASTLCTLQVLMEMPFKSLRYSAGMWHGNPQPHSAAGAGLTREAQEGQVTQQRGVCVGVSGNISWNLSKLCPKDQGGVSLTRMWECISGEGATHRGMRQQEQAIILVSLTLLGRSVSCLEQCFSKTKVYLITCRIWLKCRLWFSSSGVDSEILPFLQAPRGCQCCWSADPFGGTEP